MDLGSAKIKKGISKILQSDNYTDEYKKVIMDRLGTDYNRPLTEEMTIDTDFDLLKNGGIVISESENSGSLVTIEQKEKAVSGYLEKPTYLEDELKKAVDIKVDELISAPPKEKAETVPKPVYDALQDLYNDKVTEVEGLKQEITDLTEQLATANLAINLLNQTVDSEKLLRAAADNEMQASTDRYTAILKDFQISMQKAIQEAIERVSLSAQVEGLQAQKEVLKIQLEQMTVLVENLQSTVETQQDTAASAALLTGTPGFFEKSNQSGWKVPESSIDYPTAEPLYARYKTFRNGPIIDFYNLSDEPLIFTFTYEKGLRQDIKTSGLWIGGPTRVEVPARIESDPGKTPVTFKMVKWLENKTFHTGKAIDTIKVTVSNGDNYSINAELRARKRDA